MRGKNGITRRQKLVAKGLVEGMGNTEAVRSAGYSEAIAHNAHKVVKANGTLLALYQLHSQAGNIMSAMMADVQRRILNNELDTYSLKDVNNILSTFSQTNARIAELLPKKKDPLDGLGSIIDIDNIGYELVSETKAIESTPEHTEES